MKCEQCGHEHKRRRFCSNKCKDLFHNIHNPRGYGAAILDPDCNKELAHNAGLDGLEAGWDGHKNSF